VASLAFDAFEAWIRDRSRGCMEQDEIDEICKGSFDLDGEWYGFECPAVQAQWEAWQAAIESARR